ncbi:MAG: HD domain-containing phosphohydrolase [Planctomycetota bacterium]
MIAVDACRVLVIDDNESIHRDYRKTLTPPVPSLMTATNSFLEANSFSDQPSSASQCSASDQPKSQAASSVDFVVDSAYQGQEGLQAIREAAEAGHPYCITFVDNRMPPGWSGIETAAHILREFPEMYVVLCSAYSDHSPQAILRKFGSSRRVLYLRKPFEAIELMMMCKMLANNWLTSKEKGRRDDDRQQLEPNVDPRSMRTTVAPSEEPALPDSLPKPDDLASAGMDCTNADVISLKLRETERVLLEQGMTTQAVVYELTTQLFQMLENNFVSPFELARANEVRDPQKGNHIKRMFALAKGLADVLSEKGIYARPITSEFLAAFEAAVPLYDLGNICVPDSILLKPGKLEHEEQLAMRLHAAVGAQIIERFANFEDKTLHRMALHITQHHHEHFDGTGYPTGLAGRDIPMAARILSVVDTFNAIASKRVYKEAATTDTACRILRACRDSQFDPFIVDTFLANLDRILPAWNSAS